MNDTTAHQPSDLSMRELQLLREGDNPAEVDRAIATLAASVAKVAAKHPAGDPPTAGQWSQITTALQLLRELL